MHLGIDPGLRGALALLDDRSRCVWVSPMPTLSRGGSKRDIDERALFDKLALAYEVSGAQLVAHVEKVGAMPKQGVSSTFTFGAGWGLVRGMLCGLSIPYDLITPQAWKKVMLAGMEKGSEAAVARRLWPTTCLIPPGCRVVHDGLVDAVLIAEAGRRLWKGGSRGL